MAWILLLLAGFLEVALAYFMKRSDGFTLFGPSVITFVTLISSIWLLAIAMKTLPLGTAYSVWTGIGTVGSFLIGIAVLGEAANPVRLIAVAFIVTGIIMMKLSTSH